MVESLLTPKAVAGRLGYDVATIVRRCKAGQIPNIKLGRTYRISEHWLNEQLAKLGLTEAPATPPASVAPTPSPGTKVVISQEDDMTKAKKEAESKETKVETTPPAWNPKAKKAASPTVPPEEKPKKKAKDDWIPPLFADIDDDE